MFEKVRNLLKDPHKVPMHENANNKLVVSCMGLTGRNQYLINKVYSCYLEKSRKTYYDLKIKIAPEYEIFKSSVLDCQKSEISVS